MAIFSSIKFSGMSAPVAMRTRRSARLRLAPRLAVAALALAVVAPSVQAQASDMYIGQLMLMGNNFCPNGWLHAKGQILSIAQNTALFSLLGTTYGGNGQTTFALPNLSGRVPVGEGQGPGLSNITLGEAAGTETVTLLQSQMPMHVHATSTATSTQPATDASPGAGKVLAQSMNAGVYVAGSADSSVGTTNSGISGGSQPFGIRNPYLGMTWCIAINGVYPPHP